MAARQGTCRARVVVSKNPNDLLLALILKKLPRSCKTELKVKALGKHISLEPRSSDDSLDKVGVLQSHTVSN
jgi:predicted hotdog family 3-hydroxylacyl-ACP dehydratase